MNKRKAPFPSLNSFVFASVGIAMLHFLVPENGIYEGCFHAIIVWGFYQCFVIAFPFHAPYQNIRSPFSPSGKNGRKHRSHCLFSSVLYPQAFRYCIIYSKENVCSCPKQKRKHHIGICCFYQSQQQYIITNKKRASNHYILMTLSRYRIIPALHPVTTLLHQRYNVTESAKKHIITPISLIHNTIISSIGHFYTMESPLLLNAYYNIQP